MNEANSNPNGKPFKIKELSLDERERLVGAFAWLLEEDKKQNPDLYRPKKKKDYELETTL